MEPTIEITDFDVIKTQTDILNGIREAIYYSSLDHPHVIKAREISFGDSGIQIIFPKYIPCDKLDFDYSLCEKLFVEMNDALAYLEANDVSQSDVKPENIYYDKKNDLFLLADFDLSYYGKESLVNRTSTPATRPPEHATAIVNDSAWEIRRCHEREQSVFGKALREGKGDIFSLAVTVTMLLTGISWYPLEIKKQANELEWNGIKKTILDEISTFKYYSFLVEMLEFDPVHRPSSREIARDIGHVRNYPLYKHVAVDDYNLYDTIYGTLTDFEPLCEGMLFKKEEASRIFVTYFSVKGSPPKDILEFALVMETSLVLSALLCDSDQINYYYREALVKYFLLSETRFWHEEEKMPFDGLLHTFMVASFSVKDFMSGVLEDKRTLEEICFTLRFELLF